LSSLDEDSLYQILTKTKNSLLEQYKALMSVESVDLVFTDEAIKSMAKYAQSANQKIEDIGARRLHTVIEQVMEEISFDANEYSGQQIIITETMVDDKLEKVVSNIDMTRYIL
jgi:ATP-dependent HslUV protease ATP-binding subunit HslU